VVDFGREIPPMKSLLLSSALVLLPQDPATDPLAAHRAGRHQQAYDLLRQRVADGADVDAVALHHDLAVAALAVDDLQTAETAVAEAGRLAAGEGRSSYVAEQHFVLGHLAWRRGEAAARLAMQVEAEPFAFRPAILQIKAARDHWFVALVRRGEDWPMARRNVERAMKRLRELEDLRARAEEQRRKAGGGKPNVKIVPEGKDDPEAQQPRGARSGQEQEHRAGALRVELSAAQLQSLFERIEQREQEKRAGRLQRRAATGARVERDW
jgi:hypothetical protein